MKAIKISVFFLALSVFGFSQENITYQKPSAEILQLADFQRTPFVSIPLIITMLVAVFMVHGNDPFAKQEMALLYLFHYILIFVAGPGSISIDRMINRK